MYPPPSETGPRPAYVVASITDETGSTEVIADTHETPGEPVEVMLEIFPDIDETEDGIEYENPGPLDWANSATLIADSESDSITATISTGDPRGAFVFTVRRAANGTIYIHTPHADDRQAHEDTTEISAGTLAITRTMTRGEVA